MIETNKNNDKNSNVVESITITKNKTTEKVNYLKHNIDKTKNIIDKFKKIEIENHEEIEKNSLLNQKKLDLPTLLNKESENNFKSLATLYAHITGDTLISGTQFQGNSFTTTSSYMSHFLDFILKSDQLNLSDEIKKAFSDLKEDYSNIVLWDKQMMQVISSEEKDRDANLKILADKIADEVSSLGQEGKSRRFTLGGGWRGQPSGHAMLYEFVLNEEGSYDIGIYNTGSGVGSYHDRLLHGNKMLIKPIVRYEKVPKEALFFPDKEGKNRSIFFQNLIEYRIVPCWNQEDPGKKSVQASEIYEGTFAHLAAYRAVVDSSIMDYAQDYQTGQRSGICSFKVLLPLLFYRLAPKERLTEFKRFRHQLGFYSTLAFYKETQSIIEKDTPNASCARYLLKYGANKILLRLDRISKQKNEEETKEIIVSKEEIKVSHATMKQLLDQIEMIENTIAETQQNSIKAIDFKDLKKTDRDIKTPIQEIQKNIKATLSESASILTDSWINSEFEWNPKTIADLLEGEVSSLNKSKEKFQIERLLNALPIPSKENKEDFWSQISKEHTHRCLTALSSLFTIYNNKVFTPFPSTPEQANAVFAGYAIIASLAKKIDTERNRGDQEPSLEEYGVYFPIEILESDPYTTFYSKKTYERRLEILHYFSTEKKRQLFDFKLTNSISVDQLEYVTDGQFYGKLIDTNKQLQENLKIIECSSLSEDDWKGLKPRVRSIIDLVADVSMDSVKVNQETVKRQKKKYSSDVGGFLSGSELQHIVLLKQAAIMAQLAAGSFEKHYTHYSSNSISFSVVIKNKSLLNFTITNGNLNLTAPNQVEKYVFPSQKMHRPINEELLNYFNLYKTYFHPEEYPPKESRAMLEEFSKWDPLKTPFTYSKKVASLPNLQPYEILYYFRHYEKDNLSKPDVQTAFEIQFFKRLTIKKGEEDEKIFPLLEELKKDSTLVEQSVQFIEEGIDHFYHLQPGQRPDVPAALFFLRLSIRLKDILCQLSKEKSIDEFSDEKPLLMEWLARNDLSPEDKSLIHLHLLFYFSTVKGELNEEERLQILKSWIYVQRHLIKEEWRDPSTIECVERWIHKRLPEMKADLKNNIDGFRIPFFKSVLEEYLGQEGLQKGDWEINHPCYTLKFEETRFWSINIQTGDIATEDGKVIRTEPLDKALSNDRDFHYLFGDNTSFDANRRGEYSYFTSSLYGELRVKKNKEISENKRSLIIQRRVNGGWAEYISPIEAYQIFNNAALSADHTHWVYSAGSQSSLLEICDRKTGAVKGHVTEKGIIELVDNSQVVELDDGPLMNHLKNFEELPYLLSSCKENQWEFSFPRFNTIDGNPIAFKANSSNDKFVFQGNETLFVSPQAKVKWTGGFKNYITLANERGEAKKLLIPCRLLPSTASKHNAQFQCSTYVPPEIEDKNLNEKSKQAKMMDLYNPQQGIDTCLEFDVREGVPFAQNTEGKLLLAYIALVQKDYVKAVLYFKQLSAIDLLSPLSQTIIDWILLSATHHTDASHDAKAVRLHAAALLLRATERPEFSKEEKERNRVIKQVEAFLQGEYSEYVSLIENVDRRIRLPKRVELQLLAPFPSLLKDEVLTNRQEFLTSGSYPDSKEWVKSFDKKKKIMVFPARGNFHYKGDTSLGELSYCLGSESYPLSLTNSRLEVFEKSFITLYNLAKSKVEGDKQYICYLLLNIRTPTKEVHSGDLIKFDCLLALLELALEDPNAPSLPPQNGSKEELLNWSKTVQDKYSNHWWSRNSSKNSLKETNHVINTPFFSIDSSESPNSNKKLDEAPPLNLDRISKYSPSTFLEEYLTSKPLNENETFVKFDELGLTHQLKDKEQIYQGAFNEELKKNKIDYEEGVKTNQGRKAFLFQKEDSSILLKKRLTDQIHTIEKGCLNELKVNILRLANKLDPNEDLRQQQLLEETGGMKKRVEIEELIQAFLKGSRRAFYLLNSRLEVEEIDQLFQWVGEYCQASTELQQVRRALSWMKKIEELDQRVKDKKNEGYLLERDNLIRELGVELSAQCTYDPAKEIDCLVFEYRSGMRIRPIQKNIIDKMCSENDSNIYENLVVQLIMGGGKSKLIGPLISYKASCKPDRLSLFVVPSALYNNVKEDLKESQAQNFGQGINAIHLEREQFTFENLQWVKNELKRAVSDQEVIVVKGELLQSLCLEYFYLNREEAYAPTTDEENQEDENNKILNNDLERIRILQEQINDLQRMRKIQDLDEILTILTTQTDGIGDEVDQLLNVLKAVNFPVGEEESLSPERVDIVKEMYIAMGSGELKDKIGLHENRQNLIQESEYHSDIKPQIANHLMTLKQLCLPEEQKKAFIRYVTDTKDEKNHAEFLLFLKKLYTSQNPEESEAAHLISIAYYVLNQILPVTLSKNNNRHYGRGGRKNSPDLVVPYDGVGSPSKTKLIGNPWEALCEHFQTAISSTVTSSQIELLAKSMKRSSDHFAEKFMERCEETAEAAEFHSLTGVPLYDFERNIDKAVENVNKDVMKRLQVEAHSITVLVKFHTQKFNSSSQMLPNLLDTKRMFTGTPWNFETYDHSLSNIHLELGTVGQIADTLLRRAEKSTNKDGVDEIIHFVNSDKSQEVLKTVLSRCKRKDRVRSIIDTGALFKGCSNLQTASGVLDYYKEDASVEAVVFHHLGVWNLLKKGSTSPIRLKNTSSDELESKGVPLDKLFFYYDEKNTTGTDFVLPSNAVNLLTCDPGMLERTFFQGAMRARQLLFGQDLEYVIHNESKDLFINKAAKVRDVLSTCIKNQAIRKSKDLYKAYLQKLNYALKKQALKELMKSPRWEKREVFKKFESILMDQIEYNPFNQFSSPNSNGSPLDIIEKYAESCCERYDCKEVREDIKKILEEAKKNKDLLPKFVMNSSGAGQEVEQEMELHVNIEEETEVQVDVDQEVQKELESYQRYHTSDSYTETIWDDTSAENLLKGKYISSGNPIKKVADYVTQSKAKETGVNYTSDYSQIFDDNLHLTKNFSLTVDQPLPVFHSLQKCGDQILFIKQGESFQAYFLSGAEAIFFKNFLEKNYQKKGAYANVWLTLPDGELFVKNPHQAFPVENDSIKRLFIQINFFNGNILYLDKESDELESWLEEGAPEEGKNEVYEAKVHFIKRRVRANQREALYGSGLLDFGSKNKSQSRYTLFTSRKEQLSKPELWISKLSPEKIKTIASLFVRYLPPEKIRYLSRPAQVTKLLSRQIKNVTAVQVPLLNRKQLPFLETKEQINAIALKLYALLSSDQLELLSDKNLQLIEEPTVIQRVPTDHVKRLSEEQVEHISPSQVGYIKKEQAKFLKTKEQINALDEKFYSELDLEQLHLLSDDHLHSIEDEVILNKLSEEDIKRLKESQQRKIDWGQIRFMKSEEDFNHLDPMRYGDLSIEQWGWLKKERLQAIIDPEMIRRVPASIVPLLTIQQLGEIGAHQIGYLDRKEQINAVKIELYKEFDQIQWQRLNEDKFSFIKDSETIKKIPWFYVNHLAKEQVGHLEVSQVYFINPLEVPFLKTKEQVNALNQKAYKNLTTEQWGWLKLKKLHAIQDGELIGMIPPECMKNIAADQVWCLKTEQQVNAIDSKFYHRLYGDGLSLLNDKNLHSITDPEVIKKIDNKTVERLAEHQLQYLTTKQLDYLESIKGYWTSTPARKINSWLNKQSDYYQVGPKEGWRKVYYVANLLAPAKIAHMIAMAVNIATVVTELFLAIALLPIFVLKPIIVVAILLVTKPILSNENYMKLDCKCQRFFYNWNWSALGHFNNALAYGLAAVVDFNSVLITPKWDNDMNTRTKKWQRIIV